MFGWLLLQEVAGLVPALRGKGLRDGDSIAMFGSSVGRVTSTADRGADTLQFAENVVS